MFRKRRNSFDEEYFLNKTKKIKINVENKKDNLSYRDVPETVWWYLIFVQLSCSDLRDLSMVNQFFYRLLDPFFANLSKKLIVSPDRPMIEDFSKINSKTRPLVFLNGKSSFFVSLHKLEDVVRSIVFELIISAECILGKYEEGKNKLLFLANSQKFSIEEARFYRASLRNMIDDLNPAAVAKAIIKYFLKKSKASQHSFLEYLNEKGSIDQTLLHFFASLIDTRRPESLSAINLLIENGARLNQPDFFGNTPLHVMAYHCKTSADFLKLLEIAWLQKSEIHYRNREKHSVLELVFGFLHSSDCKKEERQMLVDGLKVLWKVKYLTETVINHLSKNDIELITENHLQMRQSI